MRNLSLEDIESIINSNLLKKQLVFLGTNRLGIVKSKLDRLSKIRIIETIKAAINHEHSLNIISEQAKQAGENRNH